MQAPHPWTIPHTDSQSSHSSHTAPHPQTYPPWTGPHTYNFSPYKCSPPLLSPPSTHSHTIHCTRNYISWFGCLSHVACFCGISLRLWSCCFCTYLIRVSGFNRTGPGTPPVLICTTRTPISPHWAGTPYTWTHQHRQSRPPQWAGYPQRCH